MLDKLPKAHRLPDQTELGLDGREHLDLSQEPVGGACGADRAMLGQVGGGEAGEVLDRSKELVSTDCA